MSNLIPELSFLLGINFMLINNNLTETYLSLIWIETLYVLPYTYLILMPAFREINLDYINVAQMFQKSNIGILINVKLPIIILLN